MAEVVAGAFLSATFDLLFDRLASPDLWNFLRRRKNWGAQKNVGRLLKKLKSKLLVLKAVLNDAEEKQFMDPAVKDWVDELKHTIYQADDLLDMVHYHVLRSKVEAEGQDDHQVRDSISSSFDNDDVEEIESKLEEIIDLLDDFVNEKDVLGLKRVAGRSWSRSLQSTSLVDESSVFGRESDKEEIIKLLLSPQASDKDIDVIPIVGMGGVGKTTLAQLVYNNSRVTQHFEIRAWACVSHIFDLVRVTKSILEKITNSTTCNTKDLDQLQVSLEEKVRGKKFLIVLDDVWNENYVCWDNLKKPLTSGAYGSKIIVTTRNQGVASIMQTSPVRKLQQLSDEDCWALFAKVAFNHGDSLAHPILEEIGKKIVKKCKGLPLAAKTLGGLLRSNLNIEEWNDILRSEIWNLPEDKNDILPALKLSYRSLSSHSKQCFAYCSIYPKDYAIEKKEIVLIWIAQNLVPQPTGNKTLEKVSDEIFRELVSRSFFQQSSCGSFFQMHDLVHDLAELVSGQFVFRLEDKKPCNIPEKVRHLSSTKWGNFDAEIFKEIDSNNYVRTFVALPRKYMGPKLRCDPLLSLKVLRVLSVPIAMNVKFDQWIGKLIHLRYLDLSKSSISKLPESVCHLYNLETLLLSNCYKLVKLPANIGKLISLRHLDTTNTSALQEMPVQISRLKSLRYLSCFVVGKNGGLGVGGLKVFEHLEGTLSILNLRNVTSSKDALEANLKGKRLLQELAFRWDEAHDDSRHEKDVLENLQPHTNLKMLCIKNFGGTTFPGWLGDSSFSNIVTLTIDGCKHCFCLPALGQLPSLRDLFIARMDGITKVGLELYGNVSNPFQSLEKLSFREMPHWEEWSPPLLGGDQELSRFQDLSLNECRNPHGVFPIPSLVSLDISHCPKLKQFFPLLGISPRLQSLSVLKAEKLETLLIPDELQNLTSLQRLSIGHCPNMVSCCSHPQAVQL